MNERLKLREKIRVWSGNCVLEWDDLMPIYRRGRESSKPWIITITWSSTSLGRNCALQLHSPFFRDQNGQLKRAPELLFWVGELVFARSWHVCSFSSRELFYVARGASFAPYARASSPYDLWHLDTPVLRANVSKLPSELHLLGRCTSREWLCMACPK